MNLNLRKSQVNVPRNQFFPCFGAEAETPLKKAKPFYQSIREMRGVLYKGEEFLKSLAGGQKQDG
jgi:hypothetical protein